MCHIPIRGTIPLFLKSRDGTVSTAGEVEFDTGEGVRFAEAIKQVAGEIDAREAAELARIRKKLKLTQQEAALLTGGGRNAFSRYERGKAKPLQSVTNLFKLLDKHPDLLEKSLPPAGHNMGGRLSLLWLLSYGKKTSCSLSWGNNKQSLTPFSIIALLALR